MHESLKVVLDNKKSLNRIGPKAQERERGEYCSAKFQSGSDG